MALHTNGGGFASLCERDFFIGYISINRTSEKPDKVFRCTKNLRRWDRLFYVVSGELSFEFDGGYLTAGAGEIVYLPNDVVYRSEWSDENDIGYITAEFILYDTAACDAPPARFCVADSIMLAAKDKSEGYLRLFERLYSTWSKGGVGYKIKARSILLDILSRISSENVEADLKKRHKEIYKGIIVLENSYTGEISVNELAKMCGMCESYFRRRFLEYAGMSPIKYKNLLRARKAAELLATGDYNVSEAASAVGYEDIAYFNRVFRTVFGENPKNFRMRNSE